MHYAGIGSRKTPENILAWMYDIAHVLGERGWTLRSGGALGADRSFAAGAEPDQHPREIYFAGSGKLEARTFTDEPALTHYAGAEPWAWDIASRLHPAWYRCSPYAKMLHARNVHQIYGPHQFLGKSEFVVCWTPDGAEQANQCTIETGGTGMAIRIASELIIPIINLRNANAHERLDAYLDR